jgi:hypothetical protein
MGILTRPRCRSGASVMLYETYQHGKLEDYDYLAEKVHEATEHLPKVRV